MTPIYRDWYQRHPRPPPPPPIQHDLLDAPLQDTAGTDTVMQSAFVLPTTLQHINVFKNQKNCLFGLAAMHAGFTQLQQNTNSN